MIYRIYVEKKEGYNQEAQAISKELVEDLGIKNLNNMRVLNRYDVQNITESLFEKSKFTIFAEPPVDKCFDCNEQFCATHCFAVEYLPGQFDQRADSAEQCIEIMSEGIRPKIRTAKLYLFDGTLSEEDFSKIKRYLINPVEAREASLSMPDTLDNCYPVPDDVQIVEGFISLSTEQLQGFIKHYGLAMDISDIGFLQGYFKNEEKRDPTISEIRMIDTYWSDHCRHTTFLTSIDSARFESEVVRKAYERYLSVRDELGIKKPVNLMNLATIAAKKLKREGLLDRLDESDEINACTVKMTIEIDGVEEQWLLLFKNETHNHPTEIEPFGGAATCIGGAIRDPLSGRAYVFAAMRITGAGNPLTPIEQTPKGKLPQRKIVTTAAAGYSSYGNQIGLATGMVHEIYHEGYTAKRMEIGAVLGAVPCDAVVRECPQPGDVVILLGGKTGRDGCGGATGSSKSHNTLSLVTSGAEVQKGNAPEERKLQRLFRNRKASLLIKRCNDFGAGGVSVAIGELADGVKINLDLVPKKYAGLDGTELAISESQERMAVVVAKKDAEAFLQLAISENLEATIVAEVTLQKRLIMTWRGKTIVDLSRDFLNSNGAEKHITALVEKEQSYQKPIPNDFSSGYESLVEDLNVCSLQGLSERFDSTIGANTVLMPFGGKLQKTPIQAMAYKIPLIKGNTQDIAMMSWGFNPFITQKSPYHGAYLAVVESICKLIATGAEFKEVYLTFQEYFERLNKDEAKWGKPLAALLGAFNAQLDFGIAAIGGKDSMSGSFENMHVPPTLVSFAVSHQKCECIVTPEFKEKKSKVILLKPVYDQNGLPDCKSVTEIFGIISELKKKDAILSIYTPGYGGVAEGIFKMCLGNGFGFHFNSNLKTEDIFDYCYGGFIIELKKDLDVGIELGMVDELPRICYSGIELGMKQLITKYESKLQSVYPIYAPKLSSMISKVERVNKKTPTHAKSFKGTPKVLIPVFPGTNCEYDTQKAFEREGAKTEIFVINNLTPNSIKQSCLDFAKKISQSQIVFIPGGFSGGDEPDGSGKFITAFLRNGYISEQLMRLIKDRDGLIGGICNGFQALLKLGLFEDDTVHTLSEDSFTLTYNTIARHQSKIVRLKVTDNPSPWLLAVDASKTYNVPISHGEGRFVATSSNILRLTARNQIITQYCDYLGEASTDPTYCPNGSANAIEGIVSPSGKVMGKMGHSERIGKELYINVPGEYDMGILKSAVKYFE